MSSTNIISKITEIYYRNIEFDQDFFKNWMDLIRSQSIRFFHSSLNFGG